MILCMSIYLYLPTYLPIYNLYIYLSISTYLPTYLSTYLPTYLRIYQCISFSPSIYHQSFCPSLTLTQTHTYTGTTHWPLTVTPSSLPLTYLKLIHTWCKKIRLVGPAPTSILENYLFWFFLIFGKNGFGYNSFNANFALDKFVTSSKQNFAKILFEPLVRL